MSDYPYISPIDGRTVVVPARAVWDVLNQVFDALTPDVVQPLAAALQTVDESPSAEAWRAGFVAAHNQERGRDFTDPIDGGLDELINAWNPHTGTGTTDPFEDEDDD